MGKTTLRRWARTALAGTATGLLALLLTTTPADSAPAPATATATTATATAGAHICNTGHRGQPAYDRACLITGTPEDAAVEWYATYPARERRQHCRTARRTGMLTVVTETRGDMIGDLYRNDRVIRVATARMGQRECQVRWGIPTRR